MMSIGYALQSWRILARHADLRKLGYYLHGDALDEVVPRLQSRVAPAALAEKEPGEEPPPDPQTPGK